MQDGFPYMIDASGRIGGRNRCLCQSLSAIVKELIVHQCQRLRGDDGDIPATTGNRGVTLVKRGHHRWLQTALQIHIEAATSLFVCRRRCPRRIFSGQAFEGI